MNSEIKNKAKSIKAILCDVDGVLTDGGIIYDSNLLEYKKFNVKDGQIVKYLHDNQFILGIITGRNSPIVVHRCNELKIQFHRHGVKNKLKEYKKFKKQYNLKNKEIAYIGDDIIDMEVLSKCGLSIAPFDAVDSIKNNVDYITKKKGGQGVFREASEIILKAQNILKSFNKEK